MFDIERQAGEEFSTFRVHIDPIIVFTTEDDVVMAVMSYEITMNPMPISDDFPIW